MPRMTKASNKPQNNTPATTSTGTPLCPKCNHTMQQRNGKNGFKFWGCSDYPRCNGYRPYTPVKVDRTNITMPQNVQGSEEQIAIWNTLVTDKRHLIVEAVAGSGKTFTIVHGAMQVMEACNNALKVLFVAFNNHIVRELETKLPANITVKTWHSYGYAQIRAWNPRVQLDENKLDNIIDEYIHEDDASAYIKASVKRLVELCKAYMYDGKNRDQLDDLSYKHGIDFNDSVELAYTLLPQILNTCKARKNVIDFGDMLWFNYAHNIPCENFDLVFMDELQDANPLQQWLAMRSIGKSGKFVGVGDRYQSIYGFAGADINSIPNIIDILTNTDRGVVTLPLNMTRRCPVSHIIGLADQIVPHIVPMPDAKIGSVETMGIEKAIESMRPGDMGICRRNSPLVSVAYKLIRANVPVVLKGRNFGDSLLALIRKLKATTIIDVINKAEQYRTKELEKLEAKGKRAETAKVALNDRIDTLVCLCEGMNDVSELKARIDKLFSDKDIKNVVTLSSCHRSKGLESSSVYIFDHSRLEIPMVQEWAQAQERHLRYVSYTRSTEKLVLVD